MPRYRSRPRGCGAAVAVAAAATLVTVAAAPAALAAPPVAGVDLRADADADGRVDVRGDTDERVEDARPAVFLPNLDDDTGRCRPSAELLARPGLAADEELAACTDAADAVLNGPADLRDLATVRLLPVRTSGDGARVELVGAPAGAVRLHLRDGTGYRVFDPAVETVPAPALRRGLELRVEGRDVVRDPAWDGELRLRVALPDGSSDEVRLRQAPVLLQHNLQRTEQVLLSAKAPYEPGEVDPATYDEYYRAAVEQPHTAFTTTLDAARRAAGVREPLVQLDTEGDPWAQDIVEPGYVSMPGPGGRPHVIRVLLRSANLFTDDIEAVAPTELRRAGRSLFAQLRGPDTAVVQQATADRPDTVDDSLNSTGNLDAVPPHAAGGVDYPAGRVLLGTTPERRPDPSFAALLDAQRVQPVLPVDTSWLAVGHVDEVLQVVPAPTPRGWTLAVPDPRGAVELLRGAATSGDGGALLFAGRRDQWWPDAPSAERTVDAVLADTALLAANERAAVRLDATLDGVVRALDLDPAELVRLPVLFHTYEAFGEERTDESDATAADPGTEPSAPELDGVPEAVEEEVKPDILDRVETTPADQRRAEVTEQFFAYSPNLANGLLLSRGVFAYTDPDGPVVGGADLFARAAADALARVGVRPVEIDAWSYAHIGLGEVHCTTNVLRDVRPDAAWWRGTA